MSELQNSTCFPKIYAVFKDKMHVSTYNEKVICHICVQEYLGCVDMLLFSNILSTAAFKKPDKHLAIFEITRMDALSMALCIQKLHSINICHLDVSLENFMIKDGQVKLIDFGLAKKVSDSNHLVNNNYGKQFYFSPEMMNGGQYDGMKRDIWSLGVCIYALFAHRMLANTQEEMLLALKHISGSFKSYLALYNPEFINEDPDLIDLLSNCLNCNPEKRFNIDEVVNHKFFFVETKNQVDLNEVYPNSFFPAASSNPNPSFINIPELDNLNIPLVDEYDDSSPDVESQMYLKKSSMRRRSMMMRLMESKGWKTLDDKEEK